MFIHAHALYAAQLTDGTIEPQRTLGSVVADTALTGAIGWDTFHKQAAVDGIAAELQNQHHVASGMASHVVLDERSHLAFGGVGGYAFTHQTAELRELASTAYGLNDPKDIRGAAHNFIEAAVDVHLVAQEAALASSVRSALKEAKIEPVAHVIAHYLELDTTETAQRLGDYVGIMTAYNLNERENWLKLLSDISRRLYDRPLVQPAAEEAPELALTLTADDFELVAAI